MESIFLWLLLYDAFMLLNPRRIGLFSKMAWKKKPTTTPKSPRKAAIPVAFREQIWLRQMGKVFEGKCPTRWCQNTITVYDFQSGHNIPESKGGPTTPENLIPLCSRCNLSMGNRYTFDEWNKLSNVEPALYKTQTTESSQSKKPWWLFCCA